MRIRLLAAAAAFALASPALAQGDLRTEIEADYSGYLEALYEHFHANPELSRMEVETAARLAAELREAGFEVTEGVGGTGLVAVMQNGEGPTLMLRADMDGLPVQERTGLPYASTAMGTDHNGQQSHVMHACAHDTHMTALVGTARRLAARRDQWSGTLVLVGQPAEELGEGARDMIADGLFTRFPTPDYNVSFHTFANLAPGQVGYVREYAMANVDTVDIHVRGVGGHGAYPHVTKDPIVLSAYIITALQTLVSRETSPLDAAVVTVGAIHAGTKHNIIPAEAHLQLTVRSYTDAVREHLLDGIERIAHAQAASYGLPEDLWPVVTVGDSFTPALYNDPALADRAVAAIAAQIGEDRVAEVSPVMGGEDFGRYGRTEEDIPTFMFWVGGTPTDRAEAFRARGEAIPGNHSPFFYPDAEAAITTAAEAMAAVALDLLAPQG